MNANTDFELRQIRASDWELAKCVRLAALADAPDAFSSTVERELQLPEASWRARAESNGEGLTTVGYFAFGPSKDVPCGVVVGVLDAGEARVALNALWVAGNVRRRGIGRRLVAAVCAWAEQRAARSVVLEVTTSSHGALALYRALGFTPFGEVHAVGERRAEALRMQRPVG
jgi:ribosomal protein S18 acetylase RimI-like enzyme